MAGQTYPEFSGKVAYITGGARGIGRATALAFAANGAQVAVVDIDDDNNAETVRQIRAAGGEAIAIHGDVTREEDVKASLTKTVEELGGIDIAVNNAGVEQFETGPTAEISVEHWDHVFATNVRSMFFGIRNQVPLLAQRGGGSIVNISSGAGVIGIEGQAAYAAAKHAVVGLTRSAGLDYGKEGIRVNAVAPGIIDTPMRQRVFGEGQEGWDAAAEAEPIGRPGRPEEIASAILWLSSANAGFMVGHVLVMDGGQTVE